MFLNRYVVTLLVCTVMLSVYGSRTFAEEKLKNQYGEKKEDLFAQEHLFGDLGGARQWLEDYAVTADLIYTGEAFWNTHGGINTNHSGEYRGDVSLFLELDTEAAGWWSAGTFFLHLQEEHGHGITEEHVGDFQVLSNMDADDFKQVSEFWYRHSFFDKRAWIKLGKMEANEDFAYVDYGGEFINSSAGFSPTIPLVSFPDQDWGVVLALEPVEWLSVNVGLYQGRPDGGRSISATLDNLCGPMVMVESAFHYEIAQHPGHLRVGTWWNGDEVEEFDNAGDFDEAYGLYLTWDQEIWRERPRDDKDEQGIGAFVQYGWAPEELSEAHQFVGGGVQWTGALPTREEDTLGLGVFHVHFSDEASFEEEGETAVELFYKAEIFPWFGVKSDVQYIRNPGGEGKDDALALGLRWEVVF